MGKLIKTNEQYKGNVNKREFRAGIPAGESVRPSYFLVATMLQKGTQEHYTVSLIESRQINWVWHEKVLESEDFKDKVWAQVKFASLRLHIDGLKPVANSQRETITLRPVGITDPKHLDYVSCNLTIVSHKGSKPYNCYHISDIVYERADGCLITQTDLDALAHFPAGQIHNVIGVAGDSTASVHTECDSGD